MKLLDHIIDVKSRNTRIQIFPIWDVHVGKRNCAEDELKKQVKEILRQQAMPDRECRVIMGGDMIDGVGKSDRKRFSLDGLADWLLEGDAMTTREKLNNIILQQCERFADIVRPIAPITLGSLEGNHEEAVKKHLDLDVMSYYWGKLGIMDLTSQAVIRLRIRRGKGKSVSSGTTIFIYCRHGYGGGRSAGAEPNKLYQMASEWAPLAQVAITGHTHSFDISPPKMVPYIPAGGRLPAQIAYKHHYSINPGCWLYSNLVGSSSYEEKACYPARPIATVKIVIWPFWEKMWEGQRVRYPKIEVRSYPIT